LDEKLMNFFIFALQIQCCESGGEHELLAGLQFMMATYSTFEAFFGNVV
jgi:hypothetical protein